MLKQPSTPGAVAVTITPARDRGRWLVESCDSDGYHHRPELVSTWLVKLTVWRQRRKLLADQRWRQRPTENLTL